MTGDEERTLKRYLDLDGQDFDSWYRLRFESPQLDAAYKRTLHRAQQWQYEVAEALDRGAADWEDFDW